MNKVWHGIFIGLSLSLAAPHSQASAPSGPEPTFWFRGAEPPPLEPMRALPPVIGALSPITDPADPEQITRNFMTVMGAVPKEGLCMSVGLSLLPFKGDEGFYHPFLQWLPYGMLSDAIYYRWGSGGIAATEAPGDYLDGPIKRLHPGFSARTVFYASPQAMLSQARMNGSVELVELRIGKKKTLADYVNAYPWPPYPHTTVYHGCGFEPLSPEGGHSSLANAFLFVRAVVFVPYMVDSDQLSPKARELWREHQNNTMMHEMVHLESLMRTVSMSAAQLRAQAEHDRIKHQARLAMLDRLANGDSIIAREAALRPKPLEAGDTQLIRYLDFIKRRFDEEAVAYHAFLDIAYNKNTDRRYDNSGTLPPYMDVERANARLQQEFDTHEAQVRAYREGLGAK